MILGLTTSTTLPVLSGGSELKACDIKCDIILFP